MVKINHPRRNTLTNMDLDLRWSSQSQHRSAAAATAAAVIATNRVDMAARLVAATKTSQTANVKVVHNIARYLQIKKPQYQCWLPICVSQNVAAQASNEADQVRRTLGIRQRRQGRVSLLLDPTSHGSSYLEGSRERVTQQQTNGKQN